MPAKTKYALDPTKHPRVAKFCAGKGEKSLAKPMTLELADDEARSLLRKAKTYGFEDAVKPVPPKTPKSDYKKSS